MAQPPESTPGLTTEISQRLGAISALARGQGEFPAFLEKACELFRDLLGLERVLLFEASATGLRLRGLSQSGLGFQARDLLLPRDQAPGLDTWSKREAPAWLDLASGWPAELSILRELCLESHGTHALFVPLGSPESPRGLLVGLRAQGPQAPGSKALHLSRMVAFLIETAWENHATKVELGADNVRLRESRRALQDLIDAENNPRDLGRYPSPPMQRLQAIVARVAKSQSPVLIQGETGTGKEVLARQLHRLSPRRDEVFLALNCAAIPEELMENELFGHVAGAYSGADRDRAGRFEAADRGTLLLDEIGEMPLRL